MTLIAACTESLAVVGVMTDSSQWPHVVHRPHHGFAALEDFPQTAQREEALVYPVQVDNVGLLKLWCASDVNAGISYRYLEKVLPAQAVVQPDDKALPVEAPFLFHLPSSASHHGNVVGLLVAHHHLGFHTVVVQRVTQTRSSHGSATGALASVYYQYSHSEHKGTKKLVKAKHFCKINAKLWLMFG